jgi:hypothetical protein
VQYLCTLFPPQKSSSFVPASHDFCVWFSI